MGNILKSQVIIESTLYTLVGLSIIAIILSLAIPQIQKIKEKEILKQSMNVLDAFNERILDIEEAPGNIRLLNVRVSKGRFEIDGKKDALRYILEKTRVRFSEPGREIKENYFTIKTLKNGRKYDVIIEINYTALNITVEGQDKLKTLQHGDYRIKIENIGSLNPAQKIQIDFEEL